MTVQSPMPPRRPPAAQYRWAWWLLGATALGLLTLQTIEWLQGRRTLLAMVNPAGLLCLSCGCLARRQPLRLALISLGIVLMLAAIVQRYLL